MIPRAPAVLGAFDGITSMLGVGLGMTAGHQPHTAIWAASVSGGLAAFSGMAGGHYQSAPEDGKAAALACGAATVLGTVIPGVPYLLTAGWAALAASAVLVAAGGGLITWLRPERGAQAFLRTYGLLAAATVLCFAGGLVTGT